MIKSIKVTGFKSLNNFKLSLREGLNILVGPNGSGKTNIISFFEFLSHLAQRELHEAVSLQGGAGAIFTKIGEVDFAQDLNIQVIGHKIISRKRHLHYYYSATIETPTGKGEIYYKAQRLKIRTAQKKHKVSVENPDNIIWDLDLAVEISDNLTPTVTIHKVDKRKYNEHRYSMRSGDALKSYLERSRRVATHSLVQALYRPIEHVSPIANDLIGGEVFNIIPSKAKLPEDIAKQPIIQKDGTGIAATLYAIKSGRATRPRISSEMVFRPRFQDRLRLSPIKFSKIINLIKLANSSIENMTVEHNPFANQLLVKITIKANGDNDIVLPLSAMSDGTIKWISLITAIITSRQIFSIEEPENFLHPWMQQEILKIMRASFQKKSNESSESFVIMSTHSETLLNSATPEEIIIIAMENGTTVAKRVTNSKRLNDEIAKTGFGLGYYYLTGILSNE